MQQIPLWLIVANIFLLAVVFGLGIRLAKAAHDWVWHQGRWDIQLKDRTRILRTIIAMLVVAVTALIINTLSL